MATVEQDDRLASVPSPRERAAVGTDPGAQGKTRQATLPTQLSAPAVESIESQTTPSAPSPAETAGPFAPAPSPHPTRRHHLLRIIATGTVAVVLVGTVLLTRADAEARSEQTRAQAQAAAIDAIRVNTHAWQARGATLTAEAAGRTIAAAEASLAATPQAGDAPRAALQAAVDAVRSALAAPGSVTDATALTAAVAGVAAPQQSAIAAQSAWQVAEDARVAAAKAAADQAAAAAAQAAADQAAAARAAVAKAAPARTATASTRTATSSRAVAAAPAAAAATSIVGVEYSAATIGAALNAFRATQGLAPMAIVRSAARVEHASAMAASNSIWHSTVRTMWEIVGRVMPVSATAMIDAYANSPTHRAVMVGNFSTAYIGAVTYNGMLYTSIQCG